MKKARNGHTLLLELEVVSDGRSLTCSFGSEQMARKYEPPVPPQNSRSGAATLFGQSESCACEREPRHGLWRKDLYRAE